MALKIKIKHENKYIDGKLTITSIKTGRGVQQTTSSGISNVSASSNGETMNIGNKFNCVAEYCVEKQIKDEIQYVYGNLHFPYNLNSKINIIQTGYEELKKIDIFKNTEDI
jgi:hypothetical protein